MDIMDHEVDVFERQEGERLVFLKVTTLISYPAYRKKKLLFDLIVITLIHF